MTTATAVITPAVTPLTAAGEAFTDGLQLAVGVSAAALACVAVAAAVVLRRVDGSQ